MSRPTTSSTSSTANPSWLSLFSHEHPLHHMEAASTGRRSVPPMCGVESEGAKVSKKERAKAFLRRMFVLESGALDGK